CASRHQPSHRPEAQLRPRGATCGQSDVARVRARDVHRGRDGGPAVRVRMSEEPYMDVEWLTKQFETNRLHLCDVAYRVLGSMQEAEDAVQETWLRLRSSDTSTVTNLGGWLRTVTARVCLDMLRARKVRRAAATEPRPEYEASDPERDILLGESIGYALLVVLEMLAPAERVAFVLHDMFDL